MIRNALAALANAWETVWRPTPEPFPMRLAMVQPVLVPAPPVTPTEKPKSFPPVRNYRIRNTSEPMQLVGVAANDLLAYPHTRNALIQALEAYPDPLRAHTIVIETRDWIGHFVVDENENHEVIKLLLVEGADVAKTPTMDEFPPSIAWRA